MLNKMSQKEMKIHGMNILIFVEYKNTIMRLLHMDRKGQKLVTIVENWEMAVRTQNGQL